MIKSKILDKTTGILNLDIDSNNTRKNFDHLFGENWPKSGEDCDVKVVVTTRKFRFSGSKKKEAIAGFQPHGPKGRIDGAVISTIAEPQILAHELGHIVNWINPNPNIPKKNRTHAYEIPKHVMNYEIDALEPDKQYCDKVKRYCEH